jgi:hypothetical protein
MTATTVRVLARLWQQGAERGLGTQRQRSQRMQIDSHKTPPTTQLRVRRLQYQRDNRPSPPKSVGFRQRRQRRLLTNCLQKQKNPLTPKSERASDLRSY